MPTAPPRKGQVVKGPLGRVSLWVSAFPWPAGRLAVPPCRLRTVVREQMRSACGMPRTVCQQLWVQRVDLPTGKGKTVASLMRLPASSQSGGAC